MERIKNDAYLSNMKFKDGTRYGDYILGANMYSNNTTSVYGGKLKQNQKKTQNKNKKKSHKN